MTEEKYPVAFDRPEIDYSAKGEDGRLNQEQYQKAEDYILGVNNCIQQELKDENDEGLLGRLQEAAFDFLNTLPQEDRDAIMMKAMDESITTTPISMSVRASKEE